MKIEKKYIRNIIIVVVSGFIIYVLLSLIQGFEKIGKSFSEYGGGYFFLAFLCIFATWVLEGIMLKTVFSGLKRISLLKSFKIAMVTQFFNLITPFYTGGQPFTIYYYSKEGVEYEKSIAAILYKTFTFQMAISILGMICLYFSSGSISVLSAGIAAAGIGINFGMALLMLLIGKNRKAGKMVSYLVLRLLSKLKFVKHPEKIEEEVAKRTAEFTDTFDRFGRQWAMFTALCLMNALSYLLYAFSAVLIIMGTGVHFHFENLIKAVLLNISASSVPTPGTAGGIEGIFFLFMNGTAAPEKITLAVFLWRGVSYYLSILVSAIFVFKSVSMKENT